MWGLSLFGFHILGFSHTHLSGTGMVIGRWEYFDQGELQGIQHFKRLRWTGGVRVSRMTTEFATPILSGDARQRSGAGGNSGHSPCGSIVTLFLLQREPNIDDLVLA